VNHYELLQVPFDSEPAVIRKAYLDAARAAHPDFHTGDDPATQAASARRMQELNEAWKVLGDPQARADYDRVLRRGSDAGTDSRAARRAAAAGTAMPAGKGWTPRAGDDRWMHDYAGWASERDDLAPEPERTTADRLATIGPLILVVVGLVIGFVGLALEARALVAAMFVCFVVAGGLFFLLPMVQMSRGRRR
jgi:curved DNA-binding protein CbpA